MRRWFFRHTPSLPDRQVTACRRAFQRLTVLRFTTRRAGTAFLSGLVSVRGEASNHGTAAPIVVGYIDGSQVRGQSQSQFAADTTFPAQIPYQGALPVPAGRHTVRLEIWPSGEAPGRLHVDQVSLVAQVLPRLR